MNTTKRVPSQESPFGLLCYKVKKSPNISNHFTLQCCRFQSQSNNHIVGGVLLKNRTRQAYLIFHGQRFDVNLCACRTILENPPKNTSIDQTSISYKQTNPHLSKTMKAQILKAQCYYLQIAGLELYRIGIR